MTISKPVAPPVVGGGSALDVDPLAGLLVLLVGATRGPGYRLRCGAAPRS